VSAPAAVTPGVPFNVTVTALDAFNNVTTGYAGTVHITATDGAATLPSNAKLTNGVGTFQVTLRTQGTQTVDGTEHGDGEGQRFGIALCAGAGEHAEVTTRCTSSESAFNVT